MNNIKDDEIIISQFEYVKDLASVKYDAEEKREQNLIQQSSQMQTVFSFMTAAIFMAAPILIQYCEQLSIKFFFVSISFVTAFLLLSLLLASLAQWRWKTKTFPDINEIKNSIVQSAEWENLSQKSYQLNQWIDLMASVQAERTKLNERRVKLIMGSMISFYCSILAIVVCFISGIIIIL